MMAKQQHYPKTTQEKFEDFVELYPQIYQKFKELATLKVNAGKRHLSAANIITQMRANYKFRDRLKRRVKINDAYTPHFARKLADEIPDFRRCFEFRRLKNG